VTLRRLVTALLMLLAIGASYAQTPTFQDCLGAIPVCSDSIVVNYSHNGMGNYANEIANVSTCYAPEQRSIWFTFTIQQSGLLRFEINPVANNQDHDWTLFNMTNGSCSQLSNAVSAASLMVRSNTWGAFGFNGSTGVSTPNGGSGTCNGPGGTNGPKWNADLSVTTGETYVLHITNWTGTTYGFTIDFSSSTAVIYDNVPPAMDSIVSSTSCSSFDSLVVQFNENVKCDSLHVGDFAFEGPGGNHTITSVSSPVCALGADYTNQVTIHFSPPVTLTGDYQLNIIPGAGYVEDVCGNLDTLDSIGFYFDGFIETQLTGVNLLCKDDCQGEIYTQVIGGTAPFTFDWNNGLSSDSNHTGVCAGQYILTLTDSNDCEVIDTIDIIEPDELTLAWDSVYHLSCPGAVTCDGGATVVPTGGTAPYSYQWSSGGALGATNTALCGDTQFVTVTDVNGCADTLDVQILMPDTIATKADGDTLICITNPAAIAASSTGGTPPFTYTWTQNSLNGSFVASTATTTVFPHKTAAYFVQSADSRGCIGDSSKVLVKVRPELGIDFPVVDTICPYEEATVTITGTGGDSTYTFAWETGVFGPTAILDPDEPTWYTVTVSDACGTPTYTDSVYVQVGGYSPIDAEIRADDDSICQGETITLIASGRGGHNGPEEYVFQWTHTGDDNPIQFVRPTKTQTYTVTISDLCLSKPSVAHIELSVGSPEKINLEALPEVACAQADVLFSHINFNPMTQYSWTMSTGDQFLNFGTDTLNMSFDEPGCYDVFISALTDHECYSEKEFPCAVEILTKPQAQFEYTPSHPTNINPLIHFSNTSEDAISWAWYFPGDTVLDKARTTHSFRESAYEQHVKLIATAESGCADTLHKAFQYTEETTLYIPSTFTPNKDGLNDVFMISGEAISHEGFDLTIYDRWGKQVFRSTNPQHGWDGTNGGSKLVAMGTYSYELMYTDQLGQSKTVRGKVLVLNPGKRGTLR